jgi:hypothetical protein
MIISLQNVVIQGRLHPLSVGEPVALVDRQGLPELRSTLARPTLTHLG